MSFAKFIDKPCDVLTSAQITTLGTFKEAKPSTDSTGPSCRWAATDPTKGISYTVSLLTDGTTIDKVTENVKTAPVYRKAEVSGLPAVSSDSTDGKGTCATAVGASSKDTFLVQISTLNESTPEYKDSCGATEKVAALVIQNLKG
ncbi:uncharacterized protein DUF3558 [Umezawaea tangerina]|uniref:Uncharacterized protein DUF3558 n=1 Tax=Umezawaea tangerina TaxID=84725 RepID=A0A2T0TAM2_9PSEU|nr:uncharacterized protein DUF3558 [Umezawaea tangerina]